jgi:prepilin-type N-terminal cleavage/methylation domain-containing protein/prepilin-type processing-associated H-X9-DG protein
MQTRSAFTLIELLVVIAIIAVLASMLFTAIPVVRESAYSMKCQGNLRQLGLAMIAYNGDNHRLPTAIDFRTHISTGWSRIGGWDMALLDFSDGDLAKVMHCDTAIRQEAGVTGTHTTTSYYSSTAYTGNRTYGMPNEVHGDDWAIPTVISYSQLWNWTAASKAGAAAMSQIGDSGGTILLSESRTYDAGSGEDLTYFGCSWSTYLCPTTLQTPHRNHANAVFCDGHVQSITLYESVGAGNIVESCFATGGMWTTTAGD